MTKVPIVPISCQSTIAIVVILVWVERIQRRRLFVEWIVRVPSRELFQGRADKDATVEAVALLWRGITTVIVSESVREGVVSDIASRVSATSPSSYSLVEINNSIPLLVCHLLFDVLAKVAQHTRISVTHGIVILKQLESEVDDCACPMTVPKIAWYQDEILGKDVDLPGPARNGRVAGRFEFRPEVTVESMHAVEGVPLALIVGRLRSLCFRLLGSLVEHGHVERYGLVVHPCPRSQLDDVVMRR